MSNGKSILMVETMKEFAERTGKEVKLIDLADTVDPDWMEKLGITYGVYVIPHPYEDIMDLVKEYLGE